MMYNKNVLTLPKSYVLLLITAFIWGIAPAIIKATIQTVPPLTFLMLRFWICAIILLPYNIYIFKKYNFNPERLNKIVTAAILGHILSLSFLFTGIELTSSIITSIIAALSPIIVSIFGYFLLKETITRKEVEGILFALIGTSVLIFSPIFDYKSLGSSTYMIFGSFLVILAVIFDAMYIIYTKKYTVDDKIITPQILVSLAFTLAAIVFTPLGLLEQYLNLKTEQSYYYRYCDQDDERDKDSGELSCDAFGCYKKLAPVYELAVERSSHELSLKSSLTPLGAWIGYKEVPQTEITTYPIKYICAYDKSIRPSNLVIISKRLISYLYPPAIYGILFMSLFSGIFAYVLYQFALKRMEAGDSSLFTYLSPVFGIPFAYLLLGEQFSYLTFAGAILIAYGIYRAERKRKS